MEGKPRTMLAELEPIWKQLTETYDAVRQALAEVPDDRLHWRPGPQANTVAGLVQHIARANVAYANMMDHGDREPRRDLEERPDRALLLDRLAESEHRVLGVFEQMTPDTLRLTRADEWAPLGSTVIGPLDGLWFAMQMVGHSAYHLGQINLYLLLWEGEREV
jgi:uncharacterized damage-inducible protein DinB